MKDPATWFQQGLGSRIDALVVALRGLEEHAEDCADTIRQLAHSLQAPAETYHLDDLRDAARRVHTCSPESLPACVETLIDALRAEVAKAEPLASTILVVDDEADVRIFLTAVLKKNGYQTVTASDGIEGLEIAKREKPDLVTLDLLMPRQSGTDFYRHLVEDEELTDIPVIVVSGLAGRDVAVKEPAAVFDKPIDSEEFLAAVNRALI